MDVAGHYRRLIILAAGGILLIVAAVVVKAAMAYSARRYLDAARQIVQTHPSDNEINWGYGVGASL
jgi:hypothetical protein